MRYRINILATLILALAIFFAIGCCDDDVIIDPESSCPNCELEPMVGPCNAAIPRYYFDQEENMCKQFIWGGCAGVVPFETLEECEACECQI